MGEQLTFNGINGATGAYLLPPMSPEQLSTVAKGDARDKEHLYDLELRLRQSGKTKRFHQSKFWTFIAPILMHLIQR